VYIGVEHAFHALALDEYRYSFTPTMMTLPKDPVTGEGECHVYFPL
jgi:hypothetical protein